MKITLPTISPEKSKDDHSAGCPPPFPPLPPSIRLDPHSHGYETRRVQVCKKTTFLKFERPNWRVIIVHLFDFTHLYCIFLLPSCYMYSPPLPLISDLTSRYELIRVTVGGSTQPSTSYLIPSPSFPLRQSEKFRQDLERSQFCED